MTAIESFRLTDGLEIDRLIVGGWQATPAFGARDQQDIVELFARYVDAGLATFDVADIYPGTEQLMGALRAHLGSRAGPAGAQALKVLTKFVPNAREIAELDAQGIEARIDRALAALQTDCIDLVQFHWWDYALPGIERFANALVTLRDKGKIAALGATNFNSAWTADLIAAGFLPVSMQVQYSLLDRRAAGAMSALAAEHSFSLICYGALAGGLLSDRWLGAPASAVPDTPSLEKYILVVDAFGGWDAYQALLATLGGVARRHGVDISTVALRWLLDQPHVAAAIVGARSPEHLPKLPQVFALQLDFEDHTAIAALLAANPGPSGDTYDLEREPDSILSETALARREVA